MMENASRPVQIVSTKGHVLVSGAGFAGLATAWWLSQLGYQVTVVEIARDLRKGGTPVDIEGDTVEILSRMTLIEAVRVKALPPRTLRFKDAEDSVIGEMRPDAASDGERYEIHRDDLLDILFDAVSDRVEVRFGRSIKEMADGTDGVAVTFDDGSRGDYALVLGCDGNRSNTRRLVFGDSDASFFMGGYFCIKVVPETGLLPADVSEIFSTAGRTALLNGYDDRTDIALAFRSAVEIDYDHRDRAAQRRMIHEHFEGLGWKVPAMLAHLDAGDDVYFDKINQIRLPCWSKGRVALVGDAGYCVSPVAGMGGSMAIIGAARLADALRRHGDDHQTAFRAYHDGLHGFVAQVQEQAVATGMAMMFPADDEAIAERDRKLSEGNAAV